MTTFLSILANSMALLSAVCVTFSIAGVSMSMSDNETIIPPTINRDSMAWWSIVFYFMGIGLISGAYYLNDNQINLFITSLIIIFTGPFCLSEVTDYIVKNYNKQKRSKYILTAFAIWCMVVVYYLLIKID